MATYAVQQDMVDRFGESELVRITDRTSDRSGTTIDTTVLARALADAHSDIDSYLMGRYSLPLTTVPTRLKTACADLARYKLYHRDPPEHIRRTYEDQVRWLEKVGEGKLALGLDSSDDPVSPSAEPQIDAPDRVFSATTLADFLGNT